MERSFFNDCNGNTGVLFGLSLTLLIGAVGVAVDYGTAHKEQVRLQGVVDLAALSGAAEADEDDRKSVATEYFKANYGGTNVPVVVYDDGTVRVTGTDAVPTTFMKLFGIQSVAIDAVGEAMVGGDPKMDACVLVLSPNGQSVYANSNGGVDANCPIYVNSADSKAIYLNAKSTVTGSEVNVVGKTFTQGQGALITPTPNTLKPAMADPLADLKDPTTADAPCTRTSSILLNSNESMKLSPGVYCGDVTLNSKASIELEPGIYTFKKQIMLNSGAKMTGKEVMIFFPSEAGNLRMNGGAALTLTAPKSGDYAGMVMFQSRTIKEGTYKEMHFNGGANTKLDGVVYLPRTILWLNGDTTINVSSDYTGLIVGRMHLNAKITIRDHDEDSETPLPTAFGGAGGDLRLTR